jgi:transcriptional regulator with XRE-family HTH domain
MAKKREFIMKQRELGRKILELRKAKGFTQEELVIKCNINVALFSGLKLAK